MELISSENLPLVWHTLNQIELAINNDDSVNRVKIKVVCMCFQKKVCIFPLKKT